MTHDVQKHYPLSNGVTYHGACLTEDLKEAVMLPLLEKAIQLGLPLKSGHLVVGSINNQYEVTGQIIFGVTQYHAEINLPCASYADVETYRFLSRMPLRATTGIVVKKLFKGVNGDRELYTAGVLEACHVEQ